MGDNLAGYQFASKDIDGVYKYEFEFNDRGRGPYFEERFTLNENGVPDYYQVRGYNYLKDSIAETFEVIDGVASWKSPSEAGSKKFDGNSFYYNINGSFATFEHILRKLEDDSDNSISTLPSGLCNLTNVFDYTIGDTLELKLMEMTGASFTPSYLWMRKDNRMFASTSPWFKCIVAGYDSLQEELLEIQKKHEENYLKQIADRLAEKPENGILIQNVNLFNTKEGNLINDQNVLVENGRISKISASEIEGSGFKVIDGSGKTLLPGLFDMHTHVSKEDGILHIAAGITSIRDLANSTDLPDLAQQFNSNSLVGPRLVGMAGFIDGAGPYAGPTGKIISSVEEGIAAVEFYKDLGYNQIKLYSSIKPEWVPALSKRAKELGMRVSGHIPAYMLAEEAVKNGYDEIQHINMIALNFLGDTLDTRTPLRFSMVGERAANIDLNGTAFTSFVSLLKENDIVVDPTVSIFEGMLTSSQSDPDPSFSMILDRLPINISRGFYGVGLAIPDNLRETYKNSYQKLIDMVGVLYESGITLVPGTDAMAGFGLHRELENYARAGIPNEQALRIATIISAQVAGVENELGSIEEGKIADLILVNGNPLENITDIRKVDVTIKDGILYDSEKLYNSVGVKHYR